MSFEKAHITWNEFVPRVLGENFTTTIKLAFAFIAVNGDKVHKNFNNTT